MASQTSTSMQLHHHPQTFCTLHTQATASHPMLQVLALTATAACHQDWIYFNIDSHPIGINNWCSACISHNIATFIDTPRPISG